MNIAIELNTLLDMPKNKQYNYLKNVKCVLFVMMKIGEG